MSRQQTNKKTTRLVALSLIIYIVLFGGVYLYMSGNMEKLFSGFTLSEKMPVEEEEKEQRGVVNREQMERQLEEQITMDDDKSDELLLEEVRYLAHKFFEDEAEKVFDLEVDRSLLDWMTLKVDKIENPNLQIKANEHSLAMSTLYSLMKAMQIYQKDEGMLDYVDDKKLGYIEDDIKYLREFNEDYAKIAEKELEKLEEALDQ